MSGKAAAAMAPGTSGRSPAANAATTPGIVRATSRSTDLRTPWGTVERQKAACKRSGKWTSAAKRPRPVTRGRSSRRRIGLPTYECSASEPWLVSLTSPGAVPVAPALPYVIGAAQRQRLDGGARVDPGAGRHAAAVGDEQVGDVVGLVEAIRH